MADPSDEARYRANIGVADANIDSHALLITGLAGLVAGAFSMAMGEWLSGNRSRELYQTEIATEAAKLEQSPEEEKETDTLPRDLLRARSV